MGKLKLSFACALYDRMQPLYTGEVQPDTLARIVEVDNHSTDQGSRWCVSAITNREWNLASEWKRFSFTPSPAPVVTRSIERPETRNGEARGAEAREGRTENPR